MVEFMRLIVSVVLSSYIVLVAACGARHAVDPARRGVGHEGSWGRERTYVSEPRSQGDQQSSAVPLVLVPAGVGLKKLLVAGGAMAIGGVLIGLCISSGACVPRSKAEEKTEGAVNRPPPPSGPPSERCKKVAEDCRVQCLDELPTPDFGFAFWNCVNACLAKNGCSPGMY
jgi:hypothetical protein